MGDIKGEVSLKLLIEKFFELKYFDRRHFYEQKPPVGHFTKNIYSLFFNVGKNASILSKFGQQVRKSDKFVKCIN